MASTTIGLLGSSVSVGEQVAAPVIEVKAIWADPWVYDPTLELIGASAVAAGHDLGTLTMRRRYGDVKEVFETDYAVKAPLDLAGWWVRLRLAGKDGLVTAWVGRVSSETREVYGDQPARSGVQVFTALQPLQILRKAYIGESTWVRDGAIQRLGWAAAFNARDPFNRLVGNRTNAAIDGVYYFRGDAGAGQLWTRLQALEYVLKTYVQDANAVGGGGPIWTVGGQTELLSAMTDHVPVGVTGSAAELVRLLVPVRLGLDYTIVPTDDGFELSVYAVSAKEFSFMGATLPANPNTVSVNAGADITNLRTTVVTTDDHRYSRVRVIGNRAVVCTSLHGGAIKADSLVPKWSSSLESAYLDAEGPLVYGVGPHPRDNDEIRRQPRYRAVYQWYGAADGWDLDAGKAAPAFDDAGELIDLTGSTGVADYQVASRGLLSWLPLREGLDYSSDPPVDANPGANEPEYLPPIAFLFDPAVGRYVVAEEAGVGVSASQTDWNVFLSASPAHRLAHGVFTDLTASNSEYFAEWQGGFQHDKTVVTVAIESDQRLALVWTRPGGWDSADGTLDVLVPDAELWYLAPETAVGVGDDGNLKTSGPEPRVLRNDSQRLAQVMVGAIARYSSPRGRASVQIKGLRPWTGLLGQILTVIDQDGSVTEIDAPITAVAWSAQGLTTVVKTGFAR